MSDGEPRKAAALLLHRRAEEGREIYLARRSPDRSFFPDHWALVGGGLEDRDGDPDDEETWRRAAVREVLEETGILVTEGVADDDARARAREAVLDGTSLQEATAQAGLEPDLEALEPAGRLVTPDVLPLRFDTRYYAAALPPSQFPDLSGSELAEGRWWTPREALEAWNRLDVLLAAPVVHLVTSLAEEGFRPGLDRWASVDTTPGGGDREPYIPARPGIRMLPLEVPTLPPHDRTNTVLVGPGTNGELLAIDPGTPHEHERRHLAGVIDDLLPEDGNLSIAVTHAHADHAGAVPWLAQRYGAPVAAHPEEADDLDVTVTHRITDGDTHDLGVWKPTGDDWIVEAVHTPGHSPGHLCFVDRRWTVVVAGDAVAGSGTVRVAPPEGDMADYVRSLERLEDLEATMVLPGHGPFLLGGDVFTETREHRLWREGKVLEALDADEARDEDDLLPAVYDDKPEEVWPLARGALQAHLEKLVEDGEAEATGDGWIRS